jgi:arginine:pyruvate transaminase
MYVGYVPIMQALDVRVRTVPLDVDRGFMLDVDAVKAAIGERTRVLFINTPGNPTGSIIPARDIRELAAYCRERDIWLVCDEVYSMFCYEGKHVSARASAEHIDNVVMIDGLSKSHAMSGWRMGWVVAPPSLVDRLGYFAGATLFGSPQFIQDASAFALENDQEYVREMRDEYRRRRDFVLHRLRKIEQLQCIRPACRHVYHVRRVRHRDGWQAVRQPAARGAGGVGDTRRCLWSDDAQFRASGPGAEPRGAQTRLQAPARFCESL